MQESEEPVGFDGSEREQRALATEARGLALDEDRICLQIVPGQSIFDRRDRFERECLVGGAIGVIFARDSRQGYDALGRCRLVSNDEIPGVNAGIVALESAE